MTLKLLNSTPFTHDKAASGTSFNVTIPATSANSILICTSAGAATVACHLGSTGGTAFTKRTTSLSTYEVACQDITDTAGGTTTIGIVINAAENVEGVIYEFAAGSLTYGSGLAHTTTTNVTDCTLGVGGSLSPAGRAVIFHAYATTRTGVEEQYYGLEPLGKIYYNGLNSGSGTKHWSLHGISDVVAGTYTPLTSRTQSNLGAWTQGCAWYYTDSTSNASYAPYSSLVQAENSRPGVNTASWFIGRFWPSTNTIYGYTDKTSYLPGSTVNFKVDSGNAAFTVEIFRMGAYGHQSFAARRAAAAFSGAPATQSAPTVDSFGGTVCAWSTTATWSIPSDAVPGFYQALIRLSSAPSTNFYYTMFIVRSPKPSVKNTSRMMIKAPDYTWQAYNVWGSTSDNATAGFTGRSVYAISSIGGSNTTRAFAVSFDRPYATSYENWKTFFFDVEMNFIFWMELCGYDIDYYSCLDIDVDTSIPALYGTAICNGHDEYWTDNMRDAFENARDSGTNLMFTGANVTLWRVRFDTAGADPNRRKMICYKDSLNLVGYDGSTKYDPVDYTGTWRDTRNVGGGVNNTHRRPENRLTGLRFLDSAGVSSAQNVTLDSTKASLPVWRNTAVAALTGASTKAYGPYGGVSMISYEEDGYYPADPDTPAHLVLLSSQTVTGLTSMADTNGATYTGSGSFSNFGMSLYQANSGALVFYAAMLRFLLGFAQFREGALNSTGANEQDLQQFMLNLLCDLGHTPPVMPRTRSTIDAAPSDYVNPAPKQPATAYGFPALGGPSLLISLLV